MNDQTFYMGEALKEAVKAYHKNEVPIGCVIVYQDKIISKAHNRRVKKESTIAHAEIIAIEKANKVIGSWRLEDCDIYVTLEPCAMCAGAIMQARMRHLYFAASDPKSGALGEKFNLYKEDFNHTVGVTCGILESESKQLIQTFFKKLREK